MTFETLSLPDTECIEQSLLQEVERLGPYLEAWGNLLRSAPKALSSLLTLYPQGGLLYTQMTNVWASAERPDPVLDALEGLAFCIDASRLRHPYTQAVTGGRGAQTAQQRIKLRNGLYPKADLALARALSSLLQHPEVASIELRGLGGAMAEVPPEATAFCHRSQEVMAAAWFHPVPEERIDTLWAPLAQSATGVYAGYTTERSVDLAHQVWPGATGARLKACAEFYDPEGLLTDGLSLRR